MYYDFEEPVTKLAGHRVLALNRGEKEKFLTVKIEAPQDDTGFWKRFYGCKFKKYETVLSDFSKWLRTA